MSTDLPKPRLLVCLNVSTGQVDKAPPCSACKSVSVLVLQFFASDAPSRTTPSGTLANSLKLFIPFG